MKRIIRLILVVLLPIVSFGQSNTPCGGAGAPTISVNASCTNSTVTIGPGDSQQTNAANGGNPSCGSMGEDVWYAFTAPASGSVDFSATLGSITDAVMAVYSGPCGSLTEIDCDDDGGAGFMPALSLSGLTPGATYFVRLWAYGGGTGNFDLCLTESAAPGLNSTCATPDPVCSGSAINFTSTITGLDAEDDINPGNNYGCLSSSPDPTWYYLEISTGGNLVIDIAAASDIDYAIWGPFIDLASAQVNCDSYGPPIDCSYSTAAVEQASVNGVIAGEVYVLVVTNFAGSVQTISINDAPSNTAETDCSIVPLPVELVNFDGYMFENEIVLSWTTVSEINNDYFIVERSKDTQFWVASDLIQGNGTTSQISEYQSIDREYDEGTNYYRLKQFDFNGGVTFSDVIAIVANKNINVSLIPNPAEFNVVIKTSEYFSKIDIINMQGLTVESLNFDLIRSTSIDISSLSKGIYNMYIQTDKGTKIERLIVM
ncbi:MAG: hypothetical protein COA38_00510 [Fluviicola sp.]|nr:MAG: hypothetical protein COA38_00510 [Fluviicola sp.]